MISIWDEAISSIKISKVWVYLSLSLSFPRWYLLFSDERTRSTHQWCWKESEKRQKSGSKITLGHPEGSKNWTQLPENRFWLQKNPMIFLFIPHKNIFITNICLSVNKNPSFKMAFCWQTDGNITYLRLLLNSYFLHPIITPEINVFQKVLFQCITNYKLWF